MRVSALHFGGTKARANLDIYNTQFERRHYGEHDLYRLAAADEILIARFFKFSVQFDFLV
jgi:hypothetical protein